MRAKPMIHQQDGKTWFNGVGIFCPGCNRLHVMTVDKVPDGFEAWPSGDRTKWSWNGRFDLPTFSPSLLTWFDADNEPGFEAPGERCHSFITDGRIQFLGDCTHSLVGKTVDLPEFEA